MDWVNRLQEPKFWLLGIAAALAALHLTLLNRIDNSDLFVTSVLFWLVAGTLVWERRRSLILHSGLISSLLGAVLLTVLLIRSAQPELNSFLRGFPLAAALGLGLLGSGVRRLHHYWRELLIFGVLFVQPIFEHLLKAINLPQLTAMAANFILWYTGSNVQRQGIFLQLLPSGSRVEVYETCSGAHIILQMVNIAVLFLMLVTLRSVGQRLFCLGLAIALGFGVNAVRVALMTILVAQKSAFEYWHTGPGSQIFSVITVLLFSLICWLVFLRSPQPAIDAESHD